MLVGWVGGSSLDLDHCSSDSSDIVFALECFQGQELYSYHKPERGRNFICICLYVYIYIFIST